MKITGITIQPRHSWEGVTEKNPLRATVKLSSDNATVETVLNDDDCQRLLDLVQDIIADAAERNVREFVQAVRAIPAEKQVAIAANLGDV